MAASKTTAVALDLRTLTTADILRMTKAEREAMLGQERMEIATEWTDDGVFKSTCVRVLLGTRIDPQALPPAAQAIVAAIEKSCTDAKLTHQRMVSRAYHDSLFMSLVCPIAMIFIPCKDGMSHRPEESPRNTLPPFLLTNGRILNLPTTAGPCTAPGHQPA